MYNPEIKIISSESKWTKYRYVASNANSRMLTKALEDMFLKGQINIVNPDKLFKKAAES